jgi:hypothetical protein
VLVEGDNGAMAATWLLLDTFAHGEAIKSEIQHYTAYASLLTVGRSERSNVKH